MLLKLQLNAKRELLLVLSSFLLKLQLCALLKESTKKRSQSRTEPLKVLVDGGLLRAHVLLDESFVEPLVQVALPRRTHVGDQLVAGDLAVVHCAQYHNVVTSASECTRLVH